MGRQMLVHGRKVPVKEMCEMIEKVDGEMVRRVAGRVFGGDVGKRATVVVMGKEDVGDWRDTLRKYGVGGHA